MGSGMSMNTLKAVLPLTIRNRTRSKVLLDAGAEGAESSRRAMVRICLPKTDLLELVLATYGANKTAHQFPICKRKSLAGVEGPMLNPKN